MDIGAMPPEGLKLPAARRIPDDYGLVVAARGQAQAVGAKRHPINCLAMAPEGDEVRVAQPFEITPLPMPILGWALVEDLVGPADVVVPPLQVGPGDALKIEAAFDPLARLLFHLLGLPGLVECHIGPALLAPQEDRAGR